MSDYEKYYVPRSERAIKSFYALRNATLEPAEFHLCAFLAEVLQIVSNNAKWHVRISDNCKCNKNFV